MLTNRSLSLSAVVGAACLTYAAAGQSSPITQFEQRGSGPVAVVLVPGLSADWTVWTEFMDRNSSNYTMYSVTLPGFGGTSAPSEQAGQGTPWLDNAVSALQQFISASNIQNPVVVGHDLGGVVATRLAIQQPGVVSGVVNVDGLLAYPRAEGMSLEQHRATLNQHLRPMFESISEDQWQRQQAAGASLATREPSSVEQITRMYSRTGKNVGVTYLLETYQQDTAASLASLTLPALVLTPGDVQALGGIPADKVGAWWTTTLAQAGPNVQRQTIDDARHFVMYDQPEAFDRAVLGFISGLSGTPAGATANAQGGVTAQD